MATNIQRLAAMPVARPATVYSVSLVYQQSRNGQVMSITHMFVVSGDSPLIETEATARAVTAVEEVWGSLKVGDRTDWELARTSYGSIAVY